MVTSWYQKAKKFKSPTYVVAAFLLRSRETQVAINRRLQEEMAELNERLEDVAIDSTVHDRRTSDAFKTKSGNQRCRLPVTVRHLRHQSITSTRSASQPRHVGLRTAFIDEAKTSCVYATRFVTPRTTLPRHIRPILLRRPERLFLRR